MIMYFCSLIFTSLLQETSNIYVSIAVTRIKLQCPKISCRGILRANCLQIYAEIKPVITG